MRTVIILCTVLAACLAEMVDLTHYNDNKTVTYPLNKNNFTLSISVKGPWPLNPKIWLQNDEFSMPTHMGTHMDAPAHFSKGGLTIDQVPLEKLVSPAVVVDHSERCKTEPNDALLVSDLEAWEAKHGRIPDGAMILARTGWSLFYGVNETKYFGMPNARNDYTHDKGVLAFPGVSPEAAEWLVRERNIYGVATETLSTDPGNVTGEFPAHVTFAAEGILLIENVASGIMKLPEKGAIVVSMPLKNRGASGSPIRMFAYWGDDAVKFQAMTAGVRSLNPITLLSGLGFLLYRLL